MLTVVFSADSLAGFGNKLASVLSILTPNLKGGKLICFIL